MKKTIKLFLALTLVFALGAGCSAVTPPPERPAASPDARTGGAAAVDVRFDWLLDTSPVTLRLFEDWPGGVDDPSLLGIQKLQAATGVTLRRSYPTAWDGQELILMLASDSLPDIIVMENGAAWKSNFIQQARDAGKIWAYDDLIEQYAPHFKELAAPEYFEMFKSDDGKTYEYVNAIRTSLYSQKSEEYGVVGHPSAVLVRQDYYDESGAPDMTTPDGFINGLKKMRDAHPNLIPLITPWDTWGSPLGNFGEQFGVAPYYAADGRIYDQLRSPAALETVLFINRLTREGLMPKESIIEGTDVQALVFNGEVISYLWGTLEEGKVPDDNPDTIYAFLKPLNTWKRYDTASIGGWKSILISKKCEYPDRAVRLLEFMASEEGHKTLYWGEEGPAPSEGGAMADLAKGPHYYIDASGKPTHYAEYLAEKAADWDGAALKSGLRQICYGEDSYFRDVVTWNNDDPLTIKEKEIYGGKIEYVPEMSIRVQPDTPEEEIKIRVDQIKRDAVAGILFAETEAACRAAYDGMLQELEEAGLAALEDYYTAQFAELSAIYR
ncbi:MAG: extracellular solute-binding protein [Clostridiales bacterium]|jgi:ABC-type glycerol-3-phosphate transport system substrate-binding protein|nr:extracellular solute-binding protein [Clostridiales bacterium]